MTENWHDYLRRVIKLDESEIELWHRIAEMVPSHYCKSIIHMMIRREKEEMETLRMLMDMNRREPCKEPYKPWPPCPPDYEPDYGPGKDPCYEQPCDPMPYIGEEKEEE
ncbi:MAG: hypothetical protein WBI44_04080 [Syntrophaceticus sp.]